MGSTLSTEKSATVTIIEKSGRSLSAVVELAKGNLKTRLVGRTSTEV